MAVGKVGKLHGRFSSLYPFLDPVIAAFEYLSLSALMLVIEVFKYLSLRAFKDCHCDF